jgi:hypothetical protein
MDEQDKQRFQAAAAGYEKLKVIEKSRKDAEAAAAAEFDRRWAETKDQIILPTLEGIAMQLRELGWDASIAFDVRTDEIRLEITKDGIRGIGSGPPSVAFRKEAFSKKVAILESSRSQGGGGGTMTLDQVTEKSVTDRVLIVFKRLSEGR